MTRISRALWGCSRRRAVMARPRCRCSSALDLDASYAGVPAVTLAFMLAQNGEVDRALAILDRMPSPSNLEPQYLMVRAIVLARSGDVAGGRALWRRLLDYTHQPAAAPAEQVLRQFMITPPVINRSSPVLRETGNWPGKHAHCT